MGSNDDKGKFSSDFWEPFFPFRDYERHSVLHYLTTTRRCNRARSEISSKVKNENGPAKNENGPAKNENGPAKNENGPAKNENGPAKNENGPIRNGNGPIRNENGPIKNENGPIKKENGPRKNENIPANKSNVTSNDHFRGNQAQDGSSAQRAPNETARGMATMTMFEHKLYLELKPKYGQNRGFAESAAELQDMKVLADLEKKVTKERNRVNEYLYSNACTTRRKDYFYIHPEANQFITDILKQELQYCLKYYPRYYFAEKIIPLLAPGNSLKDIPFTFVKVILKLGRAVPLIVPASSNHCAMYVKSDTLKRRFPPEDIGDHNIHPSKQHISRDKIAHNLGSKYGADIIISLASLTTLVDNVFPKVEHDWEIPLIVCEDEGASGAPRKCIYVEKSIPQSSLSVREKNSMYYCYSVRYRFSSTSHFKSRKSKGGGGYAPPAIPDDIKPVSEDVQAEVDKKISDLTSFEDVCEFSENVCDLDTFGVSASKKPSSHPKVPPKEQNLVLEEDKPDIKSVEESRHTSSEEDFEETNEDEDLLYQMKEMLMQGQRGLKAENSTPSISQGSGVGDISDLEKDDYVRSDNFSQCMSPLSNADSEQDRLVIDCDIEDKQSDFSASSPCERKNAAIDEKLEKPASTQLENCHLEANGKNGSDSENEVGVFARKKRKIGKLVIDSDTDSDNKNVVSSENRIKSATKKCRLSPDAKNSTAKKLPSPKCKPDNENKAPKDNDLENHTASPAQENPLDAILVSQHKMLNPGDKIDGDTQRIVPSQFLATDSMDETAKEYPQLSPEDNVQYSLWRLGDLKVMLRSEVDSQISVTGRPCVPVFLFPKLEYQGKFGYEVTTPSELIKQWVVLHTHPGSHLIKVRLDAQRTTLSMLEEIDLLNLLKNKPDLNPKHAIHQLYIILSTLKSLPEGQYLLTHKKGDYTLTLRKAVSTAKPGAFDLHSDIEQRLESVDICEDADSARKEVPWLPIDSSIALPEQTKNNRIPGCFFPLGFLRQKNLKKNKSQSQQYKSQPQIKKP